MQVKIDTAKAIIDVENINKEQELINFFNKNDTKALFINMIPGKKSLDDFILVYTNFYYELIPVTSVMRWLGVTNRTSLEDVIKPENSLSFVVKSLAEKITKSPKYFKLLLGKTIPTLNGINLPIDVAKALPEGLPITVKGGYEFKREGAILSIKRAEEEFVVEI